MPTTVLTMPKARLAARLYEQGYSQPQIASVLGRSRNAVRTALRHMNVQCRDPAEGVRARIRWDAKWGSSSIATGDQP